MLYPLIQHEWNHWRIPSVATDDLCRIAPEPGHPRGRKGREMDRLWQKWSVAGAQGIIWLDPDVVADPDDTREMLTAVKRAPQFIHCSVHKLWPASTMRDDWVWAHGIWVNNMPVLSQRLEPRADWFALGMTYTPARLLDLATPHLFQWVFGQIDNGLAAIARQNAIPAFPVPRCRPKHLHYYPREDDASWRQGYVSDH